MKKKYHKEILGWTSGFPEITIINQVLIEMKFQKKRGKGDAMKCMKFVRQNMSSISIFSDLDVIKYIDQ